MNIAFFGSPEFVVSILKNIHEHHGVSLVVSQPDKPVGRKKVLTPTPVKQFAVTHKIPLFTPENPLNTLDIPQFITLKNIDLVIVAAYGVIIPKLLLDQPKYGFINVHYSLLPKYRGASPVQAAIRNGDEKTGVTIIKMDEELDHGEIISQKEVVIEIDDTAESMFEKLTDQATPLLSNMIDYIKKNSKLPGSLPQDHVKATYCQRITKQDAFVEYSMIKKAMSNEQTALQVHNKIKAYFPWPIVWTVLPNGKRCKLIKSSLSSPTSIGDLRDSRLRGNDILKITEIQIEGKKSTKDSTLINSLFRAIKK